MNYFQSESLIQFFSQNSFSAKNFLMGTMRTEKPSLLSTNLTEKRAFLRFFTKCHTPFSYPYSPRSTGSMAISMSAASVLFFIIFTWKSAFSFGFFTSYTYPHRCVVSWGMQKYLVTVYVPLFTRGSLCESTIPMMLINATNSIIFFILSFFLQS